MSILEVRQLKAMTKVGALKGHALYFKCKKRKTFDVKRRNITSCV